MKYKPFLFIIFILVCTNAFSQKTILDSIQIKYVNPQITSIIDVTCDEFEKAFAENLKICNIGSKQRLQNYENVINNKYLLDKQTDIDVRYKIIFFGQNSKKACLIVCMDKFKKATINGELIKDESFLTLLKESVLELK